MTLLPTTLAAALADYRLDTRNRPLRMVLGQPGTADTNALLPHHASASESVCGGLELQILCLSENATLELKRFIGLPCELQIVTDRRNLRRLCGIVTAAASGHSDGGIASYKLTVRDALSVMDATRTTRVFRDKSELEIIELVLKEWQRNNPMIASTFDFDIHNGLLNRKLPKRALTMQLNESDASFVRRLMQRRGIAWFFRTGRTDRQNQTGGDVAGIGHTLVLFDDDSELARNAAGTIRFHRDGATEERDAITLWSAERTLVPGHTSLHSWDYLNPGKGGSTTSSPLRFDQGKTGNALAAKLEHYQVTAPHLGDTWSDLLSISDALVAYHEFVAKCFHAEGAVRDLAVGQWFALTGHPEIDKHQPEEREFVVTAQRIDTTNNLPADVSAKVERLFARSGWDIVRLDDTAQALRYRSSFSCVRRGIRIVPPPPVIPQPQLQSAIVVGPKDEAVWCDHLGRVKIRFPATRAQEHADGAGASGSDRDSAWVRVASGWAGNGAGNQCGARLLPPVGAEVLVAFAGGDPDKPVIIAQVYNGAAPPPAFRREDGLPANRFQSGLRSREIHGQRGNQLRLDDTTGQISAQLASDHGASELNLGYLTEPRQEGSARPRGEGAELRTEEAIALHAARGILLSAWKLLGGRGDKGAQLARDDYLGLLRDCSELCASLGNYAAQHNALAIDTAEQEALLARFTGWEDGSNTKPEAAQPGEPVIAVTSPAGIGFASSKAVVSYAGTNIDTAAQQHMQLTAGQRYSVNAGKGLSLFAHHGGLHAIAHNGKLLMQSQHDDTAIESAQNMQLTATEGTVTVTGKVILLVAADGSFLKLGDGPPVLGSKAPLQFRAPDYTFDGPESMAAQFPDFGAGGADQRLELRYPRGVADDDGAEPLGALVKDTKMHVALSDGTSLEGVSDAQGKSELMARDAMHMAEIVLSRGGEDQ